MIDTAGVGVGVGGIAIHLEPASSSLVGFVDETLLSVPSAAAVTKLGEYQYYSVLPSY